MGKTAIMVRLRLPYSGQRGKTGDKNPGFAAASIELFPMRHSDRKIFGLAMSPSTEPSLEIRMFGSWQACLHGCSLPRLRTRKGQWLLALLVLRGGEVDRDWLAATLWPHSRAEAALANLRACLKDLRRSLGAEAGRLRSATSRTLALDMADAFIDALAFDALITRGDPEALREAVDLYRGPLLEGCPEEWAFSERQVREDHYLAALEHLADQATAAGDAAAAERYLRRAVTADPTRETAQRSLMQVLAAAGNPAAALAAYATLACRLRRDWQIEPDPQTTALFRQIRSAARPGGANGGDRTALSVGASAVGPAPDESTPAAASSELETAVEWLLASGRIQPALEAAASLSYYWLAQGPLDRGRARLTELLSHPRAADRTPARAAALTSAGWLALRQGDLMKAVRLAEESVAIRRELGDPEGVAHALHGLGAAWMDANRLSAAGCGPSGIETARAAFEESLAIRRRLGDRRGISASLLTLAIIHCSVGERETARAVYREGLEHARAAGNPHLIGHHLHHQASMARDDGDDDTAWQLYSEALAVSRAAGEKEGMAARLESLGFLAMIRGEWAAARPCLEESLPLWREQGHPQRLAWALNAAGLAALESGVQAAARRHLDECLALAESRGDRGHAGSALCNLGRLTLQAGDVQQASDCFRRALAMEHSIIASLLGLAEVAVKQGDDKEAARLLGAAEGCHAGQSRPSRVDQALHERRSTALARFRSDPATKAAWAMGRAMTREQAIAYGLQESGGD